jgi:hypothetical protein
VTQLGWSRNANARKQPGAFIFREARCDWVPHVQGMICLKKIGFDSLNQVSAEAQSGA